MRSWIRSGSISASATRCPRLCLNNDFGVHRAASETKMKMKTSPLSLIAGGAFALLLCCLALLVGVHAELPATISALFAFGGVYAGVTFGFTFQQVILFGIVINVAAVIGAVALAFREVAWMSLGLS